MICLSARFHEHASVGREEQEATRAPDRLLEVEGLKTVFATDAGVAPAVDGVDFSIARGLTLVWLESRGVARV